jgi:hypothetical protein
MLVSSMKGRTLQAVKLVSAMYVRDVKWKQTGHVTSEPRKYTNDQR